MFDIQLYESYELLCYVSTITVFTLIVNYHFHHVNNGGQRRSADSAMLLHVLVATTSAIGGTMTSGWLTFLEQMMILLLHYLHDSMLAIAALVALSSYLLIYHGTVKLFLIMFPSNILLVLFNNACHRIYGIPLADRLFLTTSIGYILTTISIRSGGDTGHVAHYQTSFDVMKWFVMILLLFGQLTLLYPTIKVNSLRHASLYLGISIVFSACGLLIATQWLFAYYDNVLSWLFRLLTLNHCSMLYLSLYWSLILVAAIPIISLAKSYFHLSTIAGRKLFHFLAIALFAPVISQSDELTETFLSLAFGVAVCVLFVIEFIRVSSIFKNLPSRRQNIITVYYNHFLDDKDQRGGRGGVVVVLSHVYLLLGVAVPFWLYLVLKQHEEISLTPPLVIKNIWIMKHFGWITLGLGDSLSALGGRAYGRFKWPLPHCHKTFEGTLFGYVAMIIIVIPIMLYHVEDPSHSPVSAPIIWRCCGALAMSSVAEAVTNDNDNIVMPFTACIAFLFLSLTSIVLV